MNQLEKNKLTEHFDSMGFQSIPKQDMLVSHISLNKRTVEFNQNTVRLLI